MLSGGGSYKLWKKILAALVLFIVSGLSVAASSISDSLQFRILFPIDSSTVQEDLFDNRGVLSEFWDTYNKLSMDDSVSITGLTICGCASIDGNYEKNKRLAQRRALSVYQYLWREYSIPDTAIKDVFVIPAGAKSESILASFPETLPGIDLPSIREIVQSVDGLELKRAFLKIDGCYEGRNWNWYKKNVLEPARFAEITLYYSREISEPGTASQALEVAQSEPDEEVAPVGQEEALPIEPAPVVEVEAADVAPVEQKEPEEDYSPAYRLGTNMLYDAVTVANLSLEYGFNRHMAVNLLGTFSPWDIRRPDVKLRTLLVQPELRWYFANNFKGHYVGIEGHCGWYNVALGDKTRYQDRDGNTPLWGAGFSYGYVLPVCKHFGMDFGISAGYANLKYDCFYNIENGTKFTTMTRDWWGPTKVGISIYYQF